MTLFTISLGVFILVVLVITFTLLDDIIETTGMFLDSVIDLFNEAILNLTIDFRHLE